MGTFSPCGVNTRLKLLFHAVNRNNPKTFEALHPALPSPNHTLPGCGGASAGRNDRPVPKPPAIGRTAKIPNGNWDVSGFGFGFGRENGGCLSSPAVDAPLDLPFDPPCDEIAEHASQVI